MRRLQSLPNPFYVILIATGLLFFVTASAYFMMSLADLQGGQTAANPHAFHPLFRWLNQHGTMLLIGELIVLAIATAGVIGTDSYWDADDKKPG